MKKTVLVLSIFQFVATLLALAIVPKPNFFGFALITGFALFAEAPMLPHIFLGYKMKIGQLHPEFPIVLPVVIAVAATGLSSLFGFISIEGFIFYSASSFVGYIGGIIAVLCKLRERREVVNFFDHIFSLM